MKRVRLLHTHTHTHTHAAVAAVQKAGMCWETDDSLLITPGESISLISKHLTDVNIQLS